CRRGARGAPHRAARNHARRRFRPDYSTGPGAGLPEKLAMAAGAVLGCAARLAPPAAGNRNLYRPSEALPPPITPMTARTRGLAAFQCFEPFRRLARPMTGPPRASARPAKRSRHAVKRYIKENRKRFCGNTQCRARGRRKGRAMPSKDTSKKTAKGFAEILNAARAAGLTPPPEPDGKHFQNGALYYLALNDPVMSAAMQNARESLPGFLALARHPGPTMECFAVKIALLGDAGPEFFWIYPFAYVGDRFIGQIG